MNNAGGGLVGAGFQLAKRFLRFPSLKRFGLKWSAFPNTAQPLPFSRLAWV